MKTGARFAVEAARYAAASAVIVFVWQASSSALGAELLPDPASTIAAFFNAAAGGELYEHAAVSAERLLWGLAISAAWGFPMGLLLGHSRPADWIGAPLTYITYPLPKVVFLPVFFTLLGIEDPSRIALIALTAGYQIMVIVRGSCCELNPIYKKSWMSMGGGLFGLVRHVYIPSAVPSLITGLKVASGTALAVLFLAESFATSSGLGWLIMDAWGFGDMERMFVGILGLSLLGVSIYIVLGVVESVCLKWIRLAN